MKKTLFAMCVLLLASYFFSAAEAHDYWGRSQYRDWSVPQYEWGYTQPMPQIIVCPNPWERPISCGGRVFCAGCPLGGVLVVDSYCRASCE